MSRNRRERNDNNHILVNKRVLLPSFEVKSSCLLIDFLLENIKGKSRNNIKSLLTRHQILVDGVPISQYNFVLSKGDIVMISPTPVKKEEENEKLHIIYEDDDIIAIDKPSGLLSIASDREKGKTAYRYLTDYVRKSNAKNRIYVVHRIDKDTSGVLIAAKNEKIRDALQKDWNDIVYLREYYAVVEGNLSKKKDTIKSWLREASTNLMYSSRKPGDGKLAVTHYEVIKESKDYSLLRVKIDTGRKNQIRVHMRDIGHNIVGDDRYGSCKNPLNRLGLHASSLCFIHPFTHKKIELKTKYPREFDSLFK